MVVGDPLQIKPVLTLDSNTLYMLGEHFGVTEKYLSASASAQILADAVKSVRVLSKTGQGGGVHGLEFRYGCIEDVGIRCLQFRT